MKRSPRAIPHLLRYWQPVAARIRAKRRVLLFLDFDGTLAAIASRPDRVHVKPAIRRALRGLAAHKRAAITIISGRRRAELKHYIGLPKLNYLGLYGWERNGNERISAVAHAALLQAQAILLRELAAYPGVWIEPKQHSLSVHVLHARPRVRQLVRRAVRALLKPFRGTLNLFENLRDLEVVPHRMPGKGAAVRRALAEHSFAAALVFFFGDDLSDEPAFAAAQGGVSVLVGKRRASRARFHLRGPEEVAIALTRIKEALE